MDYELNASTNLLDAWRPVDPAWETGSAVIDSHFESVTNQVPVVEDQGLLQLEVKEN